MGVVGATASLASVIGAPFGGTLAEAYGWRLGILGYALAAVAGALVVLTFYRAAGSAGTVVTNPHAMTGGAGAGSGNAPSAFRTPIVWVLAALIGLGGMGQFSVTFFVPSVAQSTFGLDAVSAAWILSTGYLCAIGANLGVGYLMDRFNKWKVMAALFAVLMVASASMTVEHLLVFRLATATVLAGGFTAANQIYGIAGEVLRGRETGNVIGVVSLGAGVFGYLGPQMLGALRDWTGGFDAGWYMVAAADAITLTLIVCLYVNLKRAAGASRPR
jgi:predicted MFS family arabinose efflux permease